MKINTYLSNLVTGLLQIAYPPVCMNCGSVIVDPDPDIHQICPACLNSCRAVSPHFISTQIKDRIAPLYLDDLVIAFEFDPVIQVIIHQIKYNSMNRLAIAAGQFAAGVLQRALISNEADWILPVPLHRSREKERGYNQSLYLAKGIFHNDQRVRHTPVLIRIKKTTSQTRLNRANRLLNVRAAFAVCDISGVEGRSIILVDDVITSGATINECAHVLKNAGAKRVTGVALATPVQEFAEANDRWS